MHGTILTEGPIQKQLWSLAWPVMLSVFFNTLYNTVDAYWVSKLSPEAIAAVSISQITLFIMVALSMGITVGSGVIMSMEIGARRMGAAQKVLGQSFVLSAIAGTIATFIALVFKHQLLAFSGAEGKILAPAVEYFGVIAAGSMLVFIMFTIVFAFNAQGDNTTVTKLFALSTGVNALLDPMMIFGWVGLPAFGIAGAAYATLISQAVFIIAALWMLSRPSMLVPFHWSNLTIHNDWVKKVLDIGFPASLTNVLGPIGIALVTLLASKFFHEAGAVAVSIGLRVEFFAFLPGIGYGVGAMAMLGQNIGAKQFERGSQAYRRALKTGSGIAAVFGVLIALFAAPIVGFFAADPLVADYARRYLWMIPLSYGFLVAMMIQAMSFQGMGKSWPGFWLTATRVTLTVVLALIFIPVFDSIVALWSAVIAGYIATALLGAVWINRTLRRVSAQPVQLP
ncbi:MATE family efflux transporter [Candidatus Uhrbacteria bacterium]|nr:MATE family efflux transporter [Candidatus Uhrbacteria bacterium]